MAEQQYQSPQPGRPEDPPPDSFTINPAEPKMAHTDLQWRPSYLRRWIMVALCVIFFLIIVALEILLAVSNKKDGIAAGSYREHYLWTYGPTAFLTVIAAILDRVEYQSKLIAPWECMSKQAVPAARTLLLDYISQFQPYTVYTSLRNKDFTVAAFTTVSLILKLLIVLSTGLITLLSTRTNSTSIPMVIDNEFVDSNVGLMKTNTLPYFIMKSVIAGNFTYPPGLSSNFAFQSVKTNVSNADRIKVTVDGLTNSLTCEAATLTSFDVDNAHMPLDIDLGVYIMNISYRLSSSSCNMNVSTSKPDRPKPKLMGRFFVGFCDGTSPGHGERFVVQFAHLNTSDMSILESTQIICMPTYTIAKVDLVQNSTKIQSVTLSPSPSNRTLDNVSPWDIVQGHYLAYDNTMYEDTIITTLPDNEQSEVETDPYTDFLLRSQLAPGVNISWLDDPTFLEEIANGYYRQFGAIIAYSSLMANVSIDTFGSAFINENRLFVQNWAVQWMAALVAACLFLIFLTIFMIPKQGVLPRCPNTFPGMGALVSHSQNILKTLRHSGDYEDRTLRESLEPIYLQSQVTQIPGSNRLHFTISDTTRAEMESGSHRAHRSVSKHSDPLVLHPMLRFVLCLVLVALLIALELLLRRSNNEDGLGDAKNGMYIHYLWTSIPGLVFSLLAMIFSSMDSTVRALIPYTMLDNVITTDALMVLDFLDVSVPRAIYKEASLRQGGAFATSVTLLVVSFFTIFSASLFQVVSIPSNNTIFLLVNSSFPQSSIAADIESDDFEDGALKASMILESNQSYPMFTFENLAFPQLLSTTPLTENSISNSSNISIIAVIPAIRPSLECHGYDTTNILTNLTTNLVLDNTGATNALGITIEGEQCKIDSLPDSFPDSQFNTYFNTWPNTSYFGRGFGNTYGLGCSEFVFIWGQMTHSPEPYVSHVAAIGCNQTYEAVDVNTTFIGTDLIIDPRHPPRPLKNTTRNSTATLGSDGLWYIYEFLAYKETDDSLMNAFFSLLVTSRWAIPMSMLGDSSKDSVVGDAIRFQHNIIVAQHLNANRYPANTTNTLIADPPLNIRDGNDALIFTATVTDSGGHQQVKQDAVSTRILEALLSTALLLLILGWIFLPKVNVLPNRSPTTIVNQMALLAGGNLLELLPANSQWASSEEIKRSLGQGTKFRIGWGVTTGVESQVMENENENGVSRFGIFAFKPEEEKGLRLHLNRETLNDSDAIENGARLSEESHRYAGEQVINRDDIQSVNEESRRRDNHQNINEESAQRDSKQSVNEESTQRDSRQNANEESAQADSPQIPNEENTQGDSISFENLND